MVCVIRATTVPYYIYQQLYIQSESTRCRILSGYESEFQYVVFYDYDSLSQSRLNKYDNIRIFVLFQINYENLQTLCYI